MAKCFWRHIKVTFRIFHNVAFQGWVAQYSLSCQVDSGDAFNPAFEVKHECWVWSCIHHLGWKYFAEITLQLHWMGGSPFNVCLMVWKSVKKGLKQLCRTVLQERLWPSKCCVPPDSSQKGMTDSTSSMHVVEQSMHLRSRQCCHFNVEIVNKVDYRFKNISLDFD